VVHVRVNVSRINNADSDSLTRMNQRPRGTAASWRRPPPSEGLHRLQLWK